MGYKIKDILKDIQVSTPQKWKTDHLKFIQKYREAAESQVWDDSLIESFLYNNPIASVSQAGRIFKNEVDFLKTPENWSGIANTLKEIVENQDHLNLSLYEKLTDSILESLNERKESEGKKNKRNPQSAIHRMVFSLVPKLLTTIASEAQLNIVCSFIERCEDYDGDSLIDKNYYEKSHALLELIQKQTGEDYDKIASYAWRLREKISELDKYGKLLRNNKNLILTGAPGTGKTYLAKEIAKGLGATEEDGSIGFVQFHPSYDYTDFVEGLRPINKGEGIGFERKDGIFMEFCRKALEDMDNNYVFIIDEINRGEMSKIFGELFFSIDPGYRGRKGMVSTQYSNLWEDDKNARFDDGDKFYIPENVYIIGTMNDIDRSVESMDFAMRRRFAFKEISPEERIGMIKDFENKDGKHVLEPLFNKISPRMKSLNKAIEKHELLGSAYQIGPAYFLKLGNYLDNESRLMEAMDNLWDNHLYGLLFEYFRGIAAKEREDHIKKLKSAYGLKEDRSKDSIANEDNANLDKVVDNG